MSEQAVSASEMREKFADYLERVEKGRVVITKHGEARAYLISVREVRAWEETLAVLENGDSMRSIAKSLQEIKAGRFRTAHDAFTELDAEFAQEE